jgi:hypothetical protein
MSCSTPSPRCALLSFAALTLACPYSHGKVITVGGTGSETVRDIAYDAAGNVYLSATTTSSSIGGVRLGRAGALRGVLIKLGQKGKVRWARTMPAGAGHIFSGDVATYRGRVFASSHDASLKNHRVVRMDAHLYSVSTDGRVLWHHRLTAPKDRMISARIAAGPKGALYVTGWYPATPLARSTSWSAGKHGVMVSKLTKNGGLVWTRVLSTGQGAGASGIAVAPGGRILLCGTYNGTTMIGRTRLRQAASGGFLASLDRNGRPVWVKSWASKAPDVATRDVSFRHPGEIYVAGTFKGDLEIGGTVLKGHFKNNIFVARFDGRGALAWATSSSGGSLWLAPRKLLQHPNGSILLTGAFLGSVQIGKLTPPGTPGIGVFMAAIDHTGKWLKAVSGGGKKSGLTSGSSYIDKRGGLNIVGAFVDGTRLGARRLRSKGALDIFIWRLPPKALKIGRRRR